VKRKIGKIVVLMLLGQLFCVQSAMADNNRKMGIGFRGTHWVMGNNAQIVHVSTNPTQTQVDVGSGGGYFFLFSRISDAAWMEFTMGAVGQVTTHDQTFWGDEVKANAVTPVLLGLRHDFFSYDSPSALVPYVVFGAGPYWLNDVYVRSDNFGLDDEVAVKSKAKLGGYAGGGVNFMFANWFGLNLDARYHFINFNVNNEKSGWEYGFGVIFCWGKYKKNVYTREIYHRGRRRDNVHIYID
jgi:hypothetical protein